MGLYYVARKLLRISHPAEGRRQSWPEHTAGVLKAYIWCRLLPLIYMLLRERERERMHAESRTDVVDTHTGTQTGQNIHPPLSPLTLRCAELYKYIGGVP